VILAAGLLAENAPASTVTVTGTLTADNHYQLYFGDASGADLTYVGRNETGYLGNPGQYNWIQAETFANRPISAGHHLYVVAWDTGSGQDRQMWIGNFTASTGQVFASNTSTWEYVVARPEDLGGVDLYDRFPTSVNDPLAVPHANVASLIGWASANGGWGTPTAEASNGSGPWGTIGGLGPSAKFLWHDTLAEVSTSDGRFVIFRTTDPVVPLPPAVLLLGSALAGLFVLGRPRRTA
jgi:hypothetical protein